MTKSKLQATKMLQQEEILKFPLETQKLLAWTGIVPKGKRTHLPFKVGSRLQVQRKRIAKRWTSEDRSLGEMANPPDAEAKPEKPKEPNRLKLRTHE